MSRGTVETRMGGMPRQTSVNPHLLRAVSRTVRTVKVRYSRERSFKKSGGHWGEAWVGRKQNPEIKIKSLILLLAGFRK